MLEPPEPWEPRPVPRVRIPGLDGAVVSFDAAANADAIARGIDAVGVNVSIGTPEWSQVLNRLHVQEGFPERLAEFLGLAASHLGSAESVEAWKRSWTRSLGSLSASRTRRTSRCCCASQSRANTDQTNRGVLSSIRSIRRVRR